MAGPPKGVEELLIAQAQAAFAGEPVDPAAVPSYAQRGLSPNQLALALSVNYAVQEGEALAAAQVALKAWFVDQAKAFMRREQGGYRGYFEVAMALVVRIAWQRRDEEIYRYALRWWMTYVTYCSRCSVAGRVYQPGPRQGNPHSQGPCNATRDWCAGTLNGTAAVGVWMPETEEYIAPRMLLELRRTGQVPLLAPNDAYLPNLRDTLRIRRWPEGIAVFVRTFKPPGWDESRTPIEGAPFFGAVVDRDGTVLDAVSWRTTAEMRGVKWEWTDVDHENVAGYDAPRELRVPPEWGEPEWEAILGSSGSAPPLPPLPANWPTAPAPPPEEDPGPSDDEIRGWSFAEVLAAPPTGWGGLFAQAWDPAVDRAMAAVEALRTTLIAEMHRKPELRKGLRRPKR